MSKNVMLSVTNVLNSLVLSVVMLTVVAPLYWVFSKHCLLFKYLCSYSE